MVASQSFVIRTDASRDIGSGHVTRCLTLAEALRGVGASVAFICRLQEGHFGSIIESRGFPLTLLAPIEGGDSSRHEPWLDVSVDTDAAQTISAIVGGARPDWLIVDHYALDAEWERLLRPHTNRLMVIDDLADRPHDCDMLLDQNLVANFETRYATRTSERTRLLLGPRYALLQPDYSVLRERAQPRHGSAKRVLIYFGASDLPDMTGKAVSAFLALGRDDVVADVVIGPTNLQADDVAALVLGHANIVTHRHLPSLSRLMAVADLAVGAGGAATWERICLKLPALVVTLAENQRALTAELHRQGAVQWLGDASRVDAVLLADALRKSIDNLPGNPVLENLVDGLGTRRVVDQLTSTGELLVRKVRAGDEVLMLSWANDPETRANAFDPRPIEAEDHHRWLTERLADEERSVLFIAETRSQAPIGQVRFERSGSQWLISYSVAPEFRGFGLGIRVLRDAIAAFRQAGPADPLMAEVRPHNIASRKIFERLGFTCTSVDDRAIRFSLV